MTDENKITEMEPIVVGADAAEENSVVESAAVEEIQNPEPAQEVGVVAEPENSPAPENIQPQQTVETNSSASSTQRTEELENAVASNNIPQLVQVLLTFAIEQGASDIHIEPMQNTIRVRYRIDGVLHRIIEYPKNLNAGVVARIKIVSNLKIDEQRLPQDGRTQLTTDEGREMDVRVSTLPTVNGEKVCMRLQDKSRDIPDFDELGITGRNREVISKAINSPNGIFLVTGPTGSGKTTTLYSALSILNKISDNIMTCEDPVEYQMDGLNQSQMRPEINFDFASGLRTALRQDPDIIMVGEIRDLETVEIAIRAALTGHLVLSTVHTNSASETITRLIDMGAKPFLISSAVRAILAQRLVRKICPHCREEIQADSKLLENVRNDIQHYKPANEKEVSSISDMKFYRGKGCDACNGTGYKGRVGIYEALEITPEIQRLIVKERPSNEIEEVAIQEGLVKLRTDGILKALEGITTLEEVYEIVGK